MNEKAIEAAAKALWICNECSGDCFDDNGNECPHCFGSGMDIRAAIAAYEAALWRPIEEAPDEWKDGRGLLAMAYDWPDQIAVTWNAQRRAWCLLGLSSIDLGDWGEPDFLRPLPAVPEGVE